MEWYWALIVILGSFLLMMATGIPVAFAFFFLNLIWALIYFGGVAGIRLFSLNIFSSLATFTLLPIPLFILMGEVMFRSGVGPNMIDTLDKWLGRLPGRLSLLAVGGGTLFATLSGNSMGTVAMLGETLVPDMERRGYKKPMSLGPILGSGGLAIMIPPSGLAILLGAIAQISIGKILIAIIIPGLLMAALYAAYIILRCWLQPSIAPAYAVTPPPLIEKLIATVRYILPLGFVIFMVLGVIFLGVATPSEAAASGAVSTFILAAAYRRLSWEVVKKSLLGTVRITGMTLLIIASAKIFSQIVAASGAARGLIEFAEGLPVSPILIIVAVQVTVIILGMFMSVVGIMMITLPIFVPVVATLGFDTVWFAVIFLLAIEMATTSPPYGLILFVMKGVAPPDTTMGDIYKAALPFLYCDLVAMALIMAFPTIALWLPSIMS